MAPAGRMACVAGRQWGATWWAEGDDLAGGEQMLPVSARWSAECAIATITAIESDEFVARVRGDRRARRGGGRPERPAPWATRSEVADARVAVHKLS